MYDFKGIEERRIRYGDTDFARYIYSAASEDVVVVGDAGGWESVDTG
jgi:hypothetical protein